MTPEELAAAYPVGSRWQIPYYGPGTVMALGADPHWPIHVLFDNGVTSGFKHGIDWTRINAPEPVAEAAPVYRAVVDSAAAVEPDLRLLRKVADKRKASEPTPTPDDGLRERAALAALTGLCANPASWDAPDSAVGDGAWSIADAFIAAKAAAHD